MSAPPILIWGAGAIGGTIGAYLQRAGQPVHFVDRAADHVAAIAANGLAITGPIAEFRVAAPASTPAELSGRFGKVFLCVKAQDTAAAADALAPHLSDDGCVVSAQNGLNELVIAERVGAQRTIGAFVNFGADYISPGVVHYGGRGAVVIGELGGQVTPRLQELHRLLLLFDDRAILTSNIWGYLWSKLAYGALLFATALTDASIADCLASPRHRSLLIALGREVVRVAVASDVALESFNGFDPTSFRPESTVAAGAATLDALVAFNRKSAKTHSGIWRDLAVRKRRTEVDAQLGPVAAAATRRGLSAPLTLRLIELIHDIEEGRRPQDWSTLDALAVAGAESPPEPGGVRGSAA
ncbi:MAG TPA: 2-dehydropantoate 2-reductase [Methylomirabilota bacterium]|nr:2-dehydropantoate 2-reductase [Methylomirabilota bacterium]